MKIIKILLQIARNEIQYFDSGWKSLRQCGKLHEIELLTTRN